jgi:hypothetical protein
MEGLTRLVSESLARHGFDRPLDYRRLHWSRWFRCESHHSLLFVPSKPGVFAIAEEIMDLTPSNPHVETDAACPERSRRVRPASEASGPRSGKSEASDPCAEIGFPVPTSQPTAPQLDSGAATNIHRPTPLPSGF